MPEDEVVYMKQPEGFEDEAQRDMVCRLKKGLYGLKQSGRLWYQELGRVLGTIGYRQLVSDPSIYVWEKDGIRVCVLIHALLRYGTLFFKYQLSRMTYRRTED